MTVEPESAPDGGDGGDWVFLRRPFWVFSHVFALAVVVLFVNLGIWQLDRHDERSASNTVIAQRVDAEPLLIEGQADVDGDPGQLEYRSALVTGRYIDDDFVRVVNRSQRGAAGEYVVAIVELTDGSRMAVNRGFVPSNADPVLDAVPNGPTQITGWLRASVEKGRFGVDDTGQGRSVPRFNTNDLAARLGSDLPSVWLQLAGDGAGVTAFPDPVPLPSLDQGPHLGYAVQWFVFALLGIGFYLALLWRVSRTGSNGAAP